jgi:Transposase DDE domain
MSDTSRRYRAIKQALLQRYQPRPTGHREQHLNTLVALICGLIGGRQAHLPTIADHAPSHGATQESLIKRFRRFLQQEAHTVDTWFLPVAQALLQALARQPIRLVMDGSAVGRGCLALLVSVVYHGRALPLCWVVVAAPKGHFPEDTHRVLLAQVQQLMPPDATVIFLGDGEFDGVGLQADLRRYGWGYVCRTAASILITAEGVEFPVGAVAPALGEALAVSPAWMTAAQYGPISLLAVWEPPSEHPLYLVTNLSDLDAALAHYRKRAHIETFFSDQKSRGFQLQKSHLRDPARLSRLLIAACLAYLWVVYLGVCARRDDWLPQIHRPDRCDLSLFRLGLRLLARCLKDDLPIPDGFLVPAVVPPALFRPAPTQAQAA